MAATTTTATIIQVRLRGGGGGAAATMASGGVEGAAMPGVGGVLCAGPDALTGGSLEPSVMKTERCSCLLSTFSELPNGMHVAIPSRSRSGAVNPSSPRVFLATGRISGIRWPRFR